MPITNLTPFAAVDVPMLDAQGQEVVVAIVKATFEVRADGKVVPAEEGSPIRAGDVVRDPDDIRSSLLYPSDLGPAKVGTDVVIVGEAVSKAPVKAADVAVKVRDRTLTLRVHGERVFYKSLMGLAMSPSAPFERKQIVYERAYGGASEDWSVVEHRNPSGVGVAKRKEDLVDRPAPQIESATTPYVVGDSPEPVGLGAIMTHWSPRKELVGTYDEAWVQARMPLPPRDFDPRFWNVAHPSLVFESPLVAGDTISISGMTLERFVFALPAFPLRLRGRFDGRGPLETAPAIDLVLVEPSRRRFEIVGRQSFVMGRRQQVLREVIAEIA
ncbi:MAG: DUF2169 domain-containing protein [Polyangiaceae bacterium]